MSEDGTKGETCAESSSLQATDVKHKAQPPHDRHSVCTQHAREDTQSRVSPPQHALEEVCLETFREDREPSSCAAENYTEVFRENCELGSCAAEDCTEVLREDREPSSCAAEDCRDVSSEGRAARACAVNECCIFVFPPTDSAMASATFPANLDAALNTLKSELSAMRQQDLQLLKQLMHINDNIRRLKRTRWLARGGRTASCGFLGAPSPTPHPPGGLLGVGVGGRERGGGLLQRQRSEPGLLGVPFCRKVSSLTSTSSSFGPIEDGDEESDSLYGSFSDLPSDHSPAPSPFSPAKPPTTATPASRSPSTYPSLTFTQEELWRGECSYGEILKRNIRLWKWSVAHEKESGSAGGHFCVL